MNLTRREFIHLFKALLTGGVLSWLGGCSTTEPSRSGANGAPDTSGARATDDQQAFICTIPTMDPERATGSPDFHPDVEIALRATTGTVQILPGPPTEVLIYEGEVVHGDPASVQTIPSSYIGPKLHLQKGQKVRIHFTNALAEETITHWHGLHVPNAMDGHPRTAIGQGATYVYEFQVNNRAGTYWYHPHPHGFTGDQVYHGLVGLLLISDDEEKAAGLPAGEQELALVIQDRTFDEQNQLVYGFHHMIGFLGERILVNGQPDMVVPVATRPYRLRLLNGSNARIYKLAWDDGTPLTVIATDGGLLDTPLQRDYVVLAPAERVELWVDFGRRDVGSEVQLRSLTFEGANGTMRGMMGNTEAPPNGAELTLLTIRVERESQETASLPATLSTLAFHQAEAAVNHATPRTFTAFVQDMAWTFNGRTFEMEGVASEEIVKLDTLEVWEFVNESAQGDMHGMESMIMAHPIHLHGLQFQVIERQPPTDATLRAFWESVRAGFTDEGWKDTFLMMPGERVKILVRFAEYDGLFLYHCHNLEHEDMGMMRNYLIQA